MPRPLDPPRIERHSPFTAAGVALRGTGDADFAALWDDFDERADEFAALSVADECYGVMYDFDHETAEFTYLAGVPVGPETTAALPAGVETVAVGGGRFAVFETTVEDVGETMDRIHAAWLPESDYEHGDGPEFERYDPDFDPEQDDTFEVWVPVVEG